MYDINKYFIHKYMFRFEFKLFFFNQNMHDICARVYFRWYFSSTEILHKSRLVGW